MAEPALTSGTPTNLWSATSPATNVLEPAAERASTLLDDAVAALPRIGVGVLVALAALLVGLAAASLARRALEHTRADGVVTGLLLRILRILVVFFAALLGLSVAGVSVASALAGLAVVGVAVGLAIQGILENFIAGVILSFRRPFRGGDQIISGGFEGTVEGIDLRVTHLRDYDGEKILIPNRDVYTNPLINLTGAGRRRSTVKVGIDFRDDHDAARQALAAAVSAVEGVLSDPPPEVLLTALGESSLEFEVLYWTRPHIATVRVVRDRVLSAVKRGIDDAGMTIPWPIRTLVPDGRFRVDISAGQDPGGGRPTAGGEPR